jgi:biopolymer transport protein ExbD
MRKYRIKKAGLEMNLAPLIDVVFLLLIFFMVASTLNTNKVRATIQLPKVNMQTESDNNFLTLYLDKTGIISTENESIDWDNLQDYLRNQPQEKLEGIEVYADHEVDFEYIARVMAVANRINIEQIIFLLESFGR